MLDITRIEQLAKERGVSKAHLCDVIDKPRQYLQDLKRPNAKVPDATINRWSDILNTTPEYLKGETDNPARPDYAIPPEIRILARKTDGIEDEKKKKYVFDMLNDAMDNILKILDEEKKG